MMSLPRRALTCVPLSCLCFALACCSGGARAQDVAASSDEPLLAPYRDAAVERWEAEIQKLEALDASESHGPDEILLLGSSSIRRWETAAVDLAPYRVIRRGYGGAKYSDLAVFAERLIHPHQYRAVAIFVANDISGKPQDHTVAEVVDLVRSIIGVAQRHQSQSPVLLIEVTPTNSRRDAWPKIRQLNAELREIALTTPMVFFVNTADRMLDPLGRPRGDLFVEDQLHLNQDGYDVWSQLIRSRLDEVFRLIVKYPEATHPEAQ